MNVFFPILTTSLTVVAAAPVNYHSVINREMHKDEYIISSNTVNYSFEFENYKGDILWSWNVLESERGYDEIYLKDYLLFISFFDDAELEEESVVSFMEQAIKKDYFEDFYFWLFFKLNSSQKKTLLSILLSSEIDIFTSWYKKSLLLSCDSNDSVLSNNAKDIYNLYFERFEQILCM